MDLRVRRNDSMWYYSQLFNLPYPLIVDSNKEVDPYAMQIGQTIRVPGFIQTEHIIQPGDSLWSIAHLYKLPLDALFLVNQGVSEQALHIGRKIAVPLRVTWRIVKGEQKYDYQTMIDELMGLRILYPFIEEDWIGQTVLGKPIPEIRLGKGDKKIHYNGAFHANEWITTAAIMTFLNDYLLSITNQTPIRGFDLHPYYQHTSLSLVPMVNPDGVDLVLHGPPEKLAEQLTEWNEGSEDFSHWKANINGVDLNDQFPARWELEVEKNDVERPGPANYPGTGPLTQPEAKAIAQLTEAGDYQQVLAFHTQGQVIYWGFEQLEPAVSEAIVEEFAGVSGYKPVNSAYSYAGYKDWFIQEWRRPGFTVELGHGKNPLPISQFGEIYESALGIFLAGLYM